jgi:uncharacterized protein
MGTVEDIEAHAKKTGLTVYKIPLNAHFRCGGSEEYLQMGDPTARLGTRRPG